MYLLHLLDRPNEGRGGVARELGEELALGAPGDEAAELATVGLEVLWARG